MTQIKICGITNLDDAITSVQSGADMLGFNFYPPSPRSIAPEECARITQIIRKKYPEIILIGVFVNMPVDQISSILEMCALSYAQLHGDETLETLTALRGKAFKAFRGQPGPEFIAEFTREKPRTVPAFLMDASVRGLYGGSGLTADWPAAAKLAREYPLLLAGGLNPGNVAEAVRQVKPWGVDTASGVESNPRKKDGNKILAFVEAVRSVSA